MASSSATNGHPPNSYTNGLTASAHSASETPALRVPPARTATLGDIAQLLDAEVWGDAQTLISGVSGLDTASPGTISYIEHERLLHAALSSGASAFIAPADVVAHLQKELKTGRRGKAKPPSKPIVLTGNPRLAFARVMEFLQPSAPPEPGVHPTAIVEPDAYIAPGATIREGCYVGHHAHIGEGAVLYPHVVVGDGAQIGEEAILQASVIVHHHVHIGKRVRIHSGSVIGGDGFGYAADETGKHHKVPQVGTVIIEDDVEIGSNVCIDRAMMGATRVGEGTKIDNLVHIAHNTQIGRNCILCGQVGLSGSVVVEDDVIMAGQAGLADHVKIGKGAVLGAKTGIMSDIKAGEFVLGAPAMATRDFMKSHAVFRRLPETSRAVRQLEKQVAELKAIVEALQNARAED